jgi:PmbA protein
LFGIQICSLWVIAKARVAPIMSGIDDLADRVIRQLEMAKEKATVSAKVLPVIFTPRGVASVLMSPIVLAFNGKTVLEGASPLKTNWGAGF